MRRVMFFSFPSPSGRGQAKRSFARVRVAAARDVVFLVGPHPNPLPEGEGTSDRTRNENAPPHRAGHLNSRIKRSALPAWSWENNDSADLDTQGRHRCGRE